MSQDDSYFKPVDKSSLTAEQQAASPQQYFKARPALDEYTLPESVEADWEAELLLPDLISEPPNRLKWLLISVLTLLGVLLLFDIYQTLTTLWQESTLLAGVTAFIIIVLSTFILQQLWRFMRFSKRLKHVSQLQDRSEKMRHEHSHGQAEEWLKQLNKLYQDQPQDTLLKPVLAELPDYLNDAEIVDYFAEQFLSKLDRQALQLIQRDSVNSAVLITVSQLAIVDSLLVVWKTLKMINQINLIYGVKLSQLGQWRLSLSIFKAALLSYGSQAGLSFMAEKTSLGLGGKIAGSVAQGVGVGLYQARIGVNAMQQIRPVAFKEGELPKHRFFSHIVRNSLDRLRGKDQVPD